MGRFAGVAVEKDVKMVLSCCETEPNPGEISVIF
jgi:hypothetical protein